MAFLSTLFLATAVAAQSCTLQFDGRIATDSALSVFDTSASPFSPSNVFGKGLKWSEIIEFPAAYSAKRSLFDSNNTKPFTVTINDSSIFAPSSTNIQTGFRRAELIPASNSGSDASTVGVKTLHFSLKTDVHRPLNYSHEYQLAFLETADFSSNQFALKTGTIIGANSTAGSKTLRLFGNVNSVPLQILFSTPFIDGVWHNFGLVLDFEKLTTQVLYSKGSQPLVKVTQALSNNVAGRGQYHFGILKKPTGENLTDITRQGFQESGIEEAITFGGIFQEDSSIGCISLKP